MPKKEKTTKDPESLLKEQNEKIKSKKIDKEMVAALKVAQELERQEEEELMKKALEESQRLAEEAKKKNDEDMDEEMKMIQQAIELSRLEEEARLAKLKVVEVTQEMEERVRLEAE